MAELPDYLEEEQLLLAVRTHFPGEASDTDAWTQECSLEGPFSWLESFADRTTEAIFAKDSARVAAHTQFFAHQYLHGSEVIRNFIDVYYAEPLMWNANQEQKCWAWDHIAAPVRSLYEGMWGSPHC
ncbi:DUF7674 family protein [Marilutibacter alkalisoli]